MCSLGVSNVVSTFLDHLLAHLGYGSRTIGCVGAGFQCAIMAGSLVFGAAVDASKRYYGATLLCFGCSLFWLGASSNDAVHGDVLIASLLALGFFVGPIQPLTAEAAVEVTCAPRAAPPARASPPARPPARQPASSLQHACLR